jgi:hypothetical protein
MNHSLRLTEQPAEPRALLERNILMYAAVVQRITTRLSVTDVSQLVEPILAIAKDEGFGYEWLADAHDLAIGIRQIDEHLQHLKNLKRAGFRTPQIKQAAKQFFSAYKSADVKNLRDLLEHQAEYIVGRGDKRHLVVDLKQSVSFGTDAPEEEQPLWVSVFGRKCRIDRIARAVAALDGALRQGRQPPQDDVDETKIQVTLPVQGKPAIWSLPKDRAPEVLADLLPYEENSDLHKLVVDSLRQALQQAETTHPKRGRRRRAQVKRGAGPR